MIRIDQHEARNIVGAAKIDKLATQNPAPGMRDQDIWRCDVCIPKEQVELACNRG
jgi:hypothetical protein